MKTGDMTETDIYNQNPVNEPQFYPQHLPPIGSRMQQPLPYDYRGEPLQQNIVESFPKVNFISQRSEHLNELSQNLAKKHPQSFQREGGYSIPNSKINHDPNIPFLRSRGEPQEVMNNIVPFQHVERKYRREYSQPQICSHFQHQTGFNDENPKSSLKMNDIKQPERSVFQSKRNRSKIKIEYPSESQTIPSGEGGSDNINKTICEYNAMLKSLKQMESKIIDSIRNRDHPH